MVEDIQYFPRIKGSRRSHTLEDRNMGVRNATRIAVAITTFAAVSVAQTQTQAQPPQNQNQQPNQQQTQPTQPQQKKSLWQKMKETAAQGTQNTVQQGTGAVQNTVQQGTGVIQNGTQQVQSGAQQGIQGIQQGAQFPGANGNSNGAFSGGGGGAGSCGGNCFDAGPFQANVSQMTMSQQGAWHIIRMNIQFHNSSNQPLIIAYHDGSMVMVDNNGATYVPAGGNPGALQGMGIDRGNQTDSQFVLGPGQTSSALFSVARVRGNDSPVGTGYSYNFTIDELQAQNGAMAIPVRSYNLNFPSLAPSAVSSTAAAFPSVSSPAKSYAGTTTAYPATAVQPGAAVPVQQQRIVNGRVVPVTPATAINNAAIKSTATTAKAPVAATAVKPIPVATAAAPKPATPAKPTPAKKPATTTTTTTPH
jgi:hypothetical protein